MKLVEITPFQMVKGFEHMEGLSPEDAQQKADDLVAAALMYDPYGRPLPQEEPESEDAAETPLGVPPEPEDSEGTE